MEEWKANREAKEARKILRLETFAKARKTKDA